ncbi:hypothetical protein B0H13DRAFT_1913764 [Mycena leptocephala]|nr:hypothetical protein B0H13DRAFT_1913764 [Mycena leptocephala]
MKMLWDELDDNEQNECAKLAKERNSGQVDEEAKRELAAAHADKEVAAFVKKMGEIYGVRMVCMASWIDSSGRSQASVHETLTSPKFSQQFPNWKTQKGVVNAFLEYSESLADGDGSDEDDEDSAHKKAKYAWAQIDFQLFMVGSSIVPWSSMPTHEGARALIPTKYLPEGLGLRDSSRMIKSEVKAYYKLWMNRQEAGKLALVFRKRTHMEVDSDDEATNSTNKKQKSKKKATANADASTKGKVNSGSTSKAKSANAERPAPRPILTPVARKQILLGLCAFEPYQLLVEQVLKSATNAMAPAKRIPTPAWLSWDIPKSTLHPTEASDILLIVGLTLRECKACTDAEPDTPLYHIPFDIEDLGLVQEAVTSMLSAMRPKKPAKWGVSPNAYCAIDSSWRKVCLEIGLGEDDVTAFGDAWKVFVEAYASGFCFDAERKATCSPRNDGFPDKVKRWAEKPDATVDYQYNTPTSWGVEMLQVWDPIHAQSTLPLMLCANEKAGIIKESWDCLTEMAGAINRAYF